MRRVPRGSLERPDQLGHREMRTRVQLHTSDLILSQMPSQQQILHPSGGLTICRKRDKQRSSDQ